MKIFLKKINLSTVDSRYYCSFWRCYWSRRSETKGIWNCWCVDRFCSKWPITERPQIKWQYPWLYLHSQNNINNWFDNPSSKVSILFQPQEAYKGEIQCPVLPNQICFLTNHNKFHVADLQLLLLSSNQKQWFTGNGTSNVVFTLSHS